MGSVVSSLNIEGSDVQPLVPRFRVIFKYLMRSKILGMFTIFSSSPQIS